MNYGYQPLFEDRRPRNIGDTLTIVLQENVSASKSSSANASRDGSATLGLTAVPRALEGLLGGDKTSLSGEGKNDFAGKGGASANNTFTGTITVTVNQVLPNGNLNVVGEKQIEINRAPNLFASLAWSTRAPSAAAIPWCPRRWPTPVSNMSATAISTKRRTWVGCSASS